MIPLLAVTFLLASLNVPWVRQSRTGCGSAAVAMVMEYWVEQGVAPAQLSMQAEQIDRELPPGPKGLSGLALKHYLESHGFTAFIFDGEMKDLRDHAAKGRPVVVCLAPAGPKAPLHYVVFTGEEGGNVLFNDPIRGRQFREPLDAFLREWKVTGNWALLAVPRPPK